MFDLLLVAGEKKLFYINTDSDGIYLGSFFKDGWHYTYHTDGVTHTRRSIDNATLYEIKCTPLNEIEGFEQIQFAAIPFNSDYFNTKPVTAADTFDISLSESSGHILNVDCYLVNTNSENQFSKYLQSYNFRLIEARNMVPDCSTNHKLFIVLSTQESKEKTEPKRTKSKYGLITRGKFKGRRIVVSPRNHLRPNEFAMEALEPSKKAKISVYAKACLIHEELIPDNGCVKCANNIATKPRP